MRFSCLFVILFYSEWQFCSSLTPETQIIVRSKLKLIDSIIHSLLALLSDEHRSSKIVTERIIAPTTTTTTTTSPPRKARDCSELKINGIKTSGIYEIQPLKRTKAPITFRVYCDMATDGGGWTVIQRRGNFGHPKTYFQKNWKSYSDGFGDLDKDFWLGNDKLHSLTNQGTYSLRVDMTDQQGTRRYAKYQYFKVDDESASYKLHVSGYSGDAGDSLFYHNNIKFSATDRDNDGDPNYSCVNSYKGGWWYNSSFCYYTNLNGFYATDSWQGVVWYPWRGWSHSLPHVEMKIRRV